MNKIRELRMKKEISQQALAKLCGVHQTAVSQWEKNRTQPDRESLKTLSKILGVSIETLLGEEKEQDENKIPVFNFISAAELCNKLGEREYFAMTVTGDEMMPAMQDGDTVIFARSPDVENGDFAAVSVGSSHAFIKKIIKKDTSIMLVSENTEYEPIIFTKAESETLPLFILGKAIELRRKL